MTARRQTRDADDVTATDGRFPEYLGPDVETEPIDLDTADVHYRGERLAEAEAERLADSVLSRAPCTRPD